MAPLLLRAGSFGVLLLRSEKGALADLRVLSNGLRGDVRCVSTVPIYLSTDRSHTNGCGRAWFRFSSDSG